MQLNYQLWECPHSPARLVLLHGMGGTGGLWRPIAAALESEMTLLAPDQRGHGKSRPVNQKVPGTPYSPLAYGQDVIDTLAHLGWQNTWLLGHSMGVRTALGAAYLDSSERIQGLILIDLGFSGLAGSSGGNGLGSFLKRLPSSFASREECRQFMKQNCPDPAIGKYLTAVSETGTDGRTRFPFDHSALLETLSASQDLSLRPWVEALCERKLPILVLRGAQSLVWSRLDYDQEKEYFKSYPTIEFQEVQNAGHGLPFEQRQVLVDLIRARVGVQMAEQN